MRSKPSFMIKFCLARAAECRRKAEQAMDSSLQRSWRKMEGRWFFLARSYENESQAARCGLLRAPQKSAVNEVFAGPQPRRAGLQQTEGE
jgi:hypothetical protein